MKALITGASSGMGREMAKYLFSKGYSLILVARREENLVKLKKSLIGKPEVKIITTDLSVPENAKKLYEETANENIDFLINNAGFGIYGEFANIDLDREIDLINTNITAVHILNVASSAGFLAGPLMSSYYASKNYVVRLSEGIYEELRRKKSNVHISCFCPGPVKTEFNKVAGVNFAIKGIDQIYAAKYAIDNALKNKMIIMPSFTMKSSNFFMRFLPNKQLTKICYHIQRKKDN